MPIGVIIGAVIAAGASIVGSAVNASQVDDYNKMGERLANQKRQDELKMQEENNKLNRYGLRTQRMGLRQQKKEFKQGVKERESDRQYGRRQQSFANTMGMVNQNANLRSTFMNAMTRR